MRDLMVSDEEFRKLDPAKQREAVLFKQVSPAMTEVGERKIKFVISTEAVDRVNDVISADGWDLSAYKTNPVVLWAHDRTGLPIARAPQTAVQDRQLVSVAEFASYDFADLVYSLLKDGFLNAASIGMRPLIYEFADDATRPYGIDFRAQELLEWSVVPVPANPEALVQAKAAGHNIEPIMRWAHDLLAAAPENTPQGRSLRTLRIAVAEVNT